MTDRDAALAAARPAPAAASRAGDDAESLEDEHFPCAEWCRGGEPHCFTDQQPWPCDAARPAPPAAPREGPPPEYFAWRNAVRETEAMVNASVEYDEAGGHIGACLSREGIAWAALRAAVLAAARVSARGEGDTNGL